MRTSLFAPSWGDEFGSFSTPTRVKVSASSHLTSHSMTRRNYSGVGRVLRKSAKLSATRMISSPAVILEKCPA